MKETLRKKTNMIHEGLFTLAADPPQTIGELTRQALRPSSTQRERFQALNHLALKPLGRKADDIKRSIQERYMDTSQMPTSSSSQVRFFDYGWDNFVFLVEEEAKPPHIIKIDRASIDLPKEQLLPRAGELRGQYEELKQWFSGIDGLIVPSRVFIGKLPYRNKPAVGILQPYIDKPKDIFRDFTEEEMITMFNKDEKLRNDFSNIVTVIETMLKQGLRIDLDGNKNLSLQQLPDGKHQFVYLDTCDIKEAKPTHTAFWRKMQQSWRIKNTFS